MLATSLVLCAAVLHATWNTLVKFSSDRLLVVACMDVVGVLCAILLLPFVSLPPAPPPRRSAVSPRIPCAGPARRRARRRRGALFGRIIYYLLDPNLLQV